MLSQHCVNTLVMIVSGMLSSLYGASAHAASGHGMANTTSKPVCQVHGTPEEKRTQPLTKCLELTQRQKLNTEKPISAKISTENEVKQTFRTDKLVKQIQKIKPKSTVTFYKYDAQLNQLLMNAENNQIIPVIIKPVATLNKQVQKELFATIYLLDNNISQQGYAHLTAKQLKKLHKNQHIAFIQTQPNVSIPSPITASYYPSHLSNNNANIQSPQPVLHYKETTLPQHQNTQNTIQQSIALLKALHTYNQTTKPHANIAFSAYSIDQTAKAALLAMPNPAEVKRPSWLLPGLLKTNLTQSLKKPPALLPKSFQVYNQVFYAKQYRLNPNYANNYQTYLKGQSMALNFANAKQSQQQANALIKKQTQGLITQLYSNNHFKASQAILSNVLYFKANWQRPFNTKKTTLLPFTNSLGKTTRVATMLKTLNVHTAKHNGWTYIGLPFAEGSLLQLYLNPTTKLNALPSVNTIHQLLQKSEPKKVLLALPKLHLQGDTIKINQVAPEINSWQLPNLLQKPVPPSSKGDSLAPQNIWLNTPQTLHKSVISWDEAGAEAAASTAMMLSKSISLVPELRINRPFTFMIKNNAQIMFTGHVKQVQFKKVQFKQVKSH